MTDAERIVGPEPKKVSDKMLAEALVYIGKKGSLWLFKCPDEIVPAIFSRVNKEGLTRRPKKSMYLMLTPAGEAFIRAVIPR